MPEIILKTLINSKIEICFDLSRSIDFHKISTSKTNEKAIDGKTSGLIDIDETVTWEATHFGIRQKLTSKITEFERPNYFVDKQIKGIFKSLIHLHKFEKKENGILMTDIFEFESPLGVIGRIFNKLILTDYLKKFLLERNRMIKEFAENDKWKLVLIEK